MQEKYLVTPALPYANGPIHLGHLVEHIQVNIFVRALRMMKSDVLYVCGADSHGTPIEMNARKKGIPPQEFASEWQKIQESSLKNFAIEFDNGYGTTHTKLNELFAGEFFSALKSKGHIKTKEIEQLFDQKLKRFLPDRMVKGTCPKCKATEQYGDSCEACGRTYEPTELINPVSALSGTVPVLKSSEHYFVDLKPFEVQIKSWLNSGAVNEDTKAFLTHWFNEGLKDWDISRDGPYFGFNIPGESNKYFYVWLDAPIGYVSLSQLAAKKIGRTAKDYWQDKNTKIIHFIGKDIVYFHTLFWPAMLMAKEYNLPHKVIVHGMLTVDGQKMSKSRGTFILADTFSKHIDSESLRYYYACKLNTRSEDLDLNLNDFINRVNADLVNKTVNLISRTLPLLHRYFNGKVSSLDNDASELITKAKTLIDSVKSLYTENENSKAMNEIVRFSEDANKYLQEKSPWSLVKENPSKAHEIMTTGLYLGKICFALLKPVLPNSVASLEEMVNQGIEFTFDNIADDFCPEQELSPYKHLFKRIEQSQVEKMVEESKQDTNDKKTEQASKTIDIKQFMDVELRAAKVLSAQAVEGSDKLISCELDLGPLGKRHVFAGLRPFVDPADLVEKTVAVVANLAPRKMRFGVSEGMILACGDKKPTPIILQDVEPGDRVR